MFCPAIKQVRSYARRKRYLRKSIYLPDFHTMKHRSLIRLFVLGLPLVGALAHAQAKPANNNGNRPSKPIRETHLDVRGEVIELQGRNALRLRTRGGRVVSVQTRQAFDSGIAVGDLVRARGSFDGSILHADNVNLLIDKGEGDQADLVPEQNLTIPGIVRAVRAGEIEVQNTKHGTYIVHTSRVRFTGRVGDRVVVQGVARDGFIEANRISRTR